ncbi:MAG: GFA family protein [Gammaproteobacteria bacterium]|nr:GFA family protein [Gammaproteobacteria bacterium]
MIYRGGCHCGAVQFEVEAPESVEVEDCNCSICRKTGFLHLIVPLQSFRLLSGADTLTTYRFNTGVAEHKFCRVCGIKSFYIPRSNPDGVDVNLRCLATQPDQVKIVSFDGDNWEAHGAKLASKSKPVP